MKQPLVQFKHVAYEKLNSRQKENRNYHAVAALLSGYGYTSIRLSDDWKGADFLAVHLDGKTTLHVQLKSRPTIKRHYENSGIYIAFPIKGAWYILPHDKLVDVMKSESKWLETKSWKKKGGGYSSAGLSKRALSAISSYRLHPIK